MKIVLPLLGSLAGLLVLAGCVLYFLGRRLPEWHTSRHTVKLPAPRAAVWAVITDYVKMPEWWPDVKSVTLEERPDGQVWAWNRDARGQLVAFRTREEAAPAKLVREIAGDGLPFGGTWTFELADEGGATQLTITENGFIRPPLFRAVAHYFLDLSQTMKSFAASLERKLTAK